MLLSKLEYFNKMYFTFRVDQARNRRCRGLDPCHHFQPPEGVGTPENPKYSLIQTIHACRPSAWAFISYHIASQHFCMAFETWPHTIPPTFLCAFTASISLSEIVSVRLSAPDHHTLCLSLSFLQ